MVEKLKELIKNGSIKNVSNFGERKLALPLPNITITPEPEPKNQQAYTIWAEFAIGKEKELETYIKFELPQLVFAEKNLLGQSVFKSNGSYIGVVANPERGSIRAGKTFFLPLIIK